MPRETEVYSGREAIYLVSSIWQRGCLNEQHMSAEPKPDLPLEIAHLLLIDVLGYSKLLDNDQDESLQELNHIVRSTDCFRPAEAKDKLIRLPTGEGIELLVIENLE